MPTGVLVALVSVAALLCVALFVVMYLDKNGKLDAGTEETQEAGQEAGESVSEDTATVKIDGGYTMGADADGFAPEEVEAEDSIPVPDNVNVDIKGLRDTVNPDVYAWLYVPDTGIDTPIVQDPEDLTYYSSHNLEKKEDEGGAVFTQPLNTKEFNDNVTVIYGRNLEDGNGFSNLDVYADPAFFKDHPYIYVYTEDKILIYETFAAYVSNDRHIIVFYNTYVDDQYKLYLSEIKDLIGLDGNVNEDAFPTYEDKILTLSTGIPDKPENRYLVQARFLGSKDY